MDKLVELVVVVSDHSIKAQSLDLPSGCTVALLRSVVAVRLSDPTSGQDTPVISVTLQGGGSRYKVILQQTDFLASIL